MRLHEIIRTRRQALGLTQEQLAQKLGVSAPAVNKWERALNYPDITLLPALARTLGVDLNTLLSFQEDLTDEEIGLFLNQLYEISQEAGCGAAFQLARDKLALEARREQFSREGRQLNEALLDATQAESRLQRKLESSAMEEKQLLDKLWENYELSHSAALEQRVELESVSKATRRIAELNREIKALGPPNIGAIEEFERVNGRYTYLSEQRGDVEKAKEELNGVIEQLTRQMTEIFGQQFKLLNESFQETFLELFGGGKAQLELEDENDILSCGIEIKVQPPGKQLKTITLLSGGEKAFVAIALYFAILKVHPTPFCVMDEIEAALDEANVVRYARYMRRIAGKTQFIVITHRRGTMEEADVLYGVTMQEKGVSRILTINLNDMAKELKIK